MTHEEIIKLAEQCGIPEFEQNESQASNLIAFAKLIAQAEREACAKVCEELGKNDDSFYAEFSRSEDCASAIRTRINT